VSDDDLSRSVRAARERRKRNIALAIVLGGLAILVYVMSLVQWHGGH
jgi:hypothetical protein